jgi:hypothetical protein
MSGSDAKTISQNLYSFTFGIHLPARAVDGGKLTQITLSNPGIEHGQNTKNRVLVIALGFTHLG